MSSEDGLAVVLRSQSEHLDALKVQADEGLDAARRTSDRLGALEQDLFGEVSSFSEPDGKASARRASTRPDRVAPSFDSLLEQSSAHLVSLGIDPGSASFDDMLDPEETRRIERRFDTDFTIHARLDGYDILAIAAAGLTASLLDILLVATPGTSPLTTWLRGQAVPSDNNLADWAKVPFDRVGRALPEPVAGLGPLTHRVQTLGHDPLLGLLFGVRDIMRGTMTVSPRGGGIQVLDIGEGVSNPFMALAIELAHLLSDVGTKSGLPLPGWTALVSLGGPTFGPLAKGGPIGSPQAQENLGEIARRMYINGYDSWHLMSMATSAAAVDVILRGYWGLRSHLDPDWRQVIDLEGERHGSSKVSDHPRFASMSLGAHGVAATGNLVKFALAGGNPLALNYAEWLAFLRAFYRWADDRQGSVAGRVDRGMRANARAVEAGWARLDFTDERFVDLVERSTPPDGGVGA